MQIRNTRESDLPAVMEIYAYAREQMKRNGNPTQWGDNRPSEKTIKDDIKDGTSFVITEKEEVIGVFAFIIGEDPTYVVIEDGEWLNDKPYGVIHRIASGGKKRGVLEASLKFCEARIDNIRIDTHEDNKIMQHLLEKNNYRKCGTIYIDDGTPRIAYHKANCTIKDKKMSELL